MEKLRKPYQGVLNIIRFNWHFYAIAFFVILLLFITANNTEQPFNLISITIGFLVLYSVLISLLVSFYVYDLSGFYEFKWLDKNNTKITIANINAGFDETSTILKQKFKNSTLIVLDFYDSKKHTEVSIKRARKMYPSYPNTKKIETAKIELPDNSIDKIFLILSAHEIRTKTEQILFFKELHRLLKPTGQIIVTEHLRDIPNFLAYTIGFIHFQSKPNWIKTFKNSNLKITKEIKNTPFITTFILNKNGNTL